MSGGSISRHGPMPAYDPDRPNPSLVSKSRGEGVRTSTRRAQHGECVNAQGFGHQERVETDGREAGRGVGRTPIAWPIERDQTYVLPTCRVGAVHGLKPPRRCAVVEHDRHAVRIAALPDLECSVVRKGHQATTSLIRHGIEDRPNDGRCCLLRERCGAADPSITPGACAPVIRRHAAGIADVFAAAADHVNADQDDEDDGPDTSALVPCQRRR